MDPSVLKVALLLPALYEGHLMMFLHSLLCTQRRQASHCGYPSILSSTQCVLCFHYRVFGEYQNIPEKIKVDCSSLWKPRWGNKFQCELFVIHKIMCWRTWSPARGSGLGGCRNQLQVLGVNPLECALMVTPTSASVSYSHQPEMRGSLTTLSLMPGHSDHCTFPPYWTEPAETIRQNAF